MILEWAPRAVSDLTRLHDYLAPVAPDAAQRTMERLGDAPRKLLDFPRIGSQLDGYLPREVRRIIVGDYELRYEIVDATIYVLRVWHCRENRSFTPDD